MQETENKKSLLKRVIAIILGFGPGIFAIGYTIGTGSVTSMIVAGSKFNMQLLWGTFIKLLFFRNFNVCVWKLCFINW